MDLSEASEKILSDTTGDRSGDLSNSSETTDLVGQKINFTKTSTATSTTDININMIILV
jgi:hypothetical protein